MPPNTSPTALVCVRLWVSDAKSAAVPRPRFSAAANIPTPNPFVNISLSPAFAPAFVFKLPASTNPVTLNPKMGSCNSIVCPPANATPASLQTCIAPNMTALAASTPNTSTGQPITAFAITGLPPIAQISLKALAAAALPKSNGSSSSGVKKSTVCNNNCPLPKSNTEQSSPPAFPCTKPGVAPACSVIPCNICCNTAGWILHPQPLAFENSVSFFVIPLQKSQKVGTVLGELPTKRVITPTKH